MSTEVKSNDLFAPGMLAVPVRRQGTDMRRMRKPLLSGARHNYEHAMQNALTVCYASRREAKPSAVYQVCLANEHRPRSSCVDSKSKGQTGQCPTRSKGLYSQYWCEGWAMASDTVARDVH